MEFTTNMANFLTPPVALSTLTNSIHCLWTKIDLLSLVMAQGGPVYKFEGLLEFHGEGFLKILPFKMKGYLKNCLSHRY